MVISDCNEIHKPSSDRETGKEPLVIIASSVMNEKKEDGSDFLFCFDFRSDFPASVHVSNFVLAALLKSELRIRKH